MLVLFHHSHSTLSSTKESPPIIAMALSNQAATATLSASNEQFSARGESLVLTNLRPLTSSVSPRSLTSLTN